MAMADRFDIWCLNHGMDIDLALYADLATYYGVCCMVGLIEGLYIGSRMFCIG